MVTVAGGQAAFGKGVLAEVPGVRKRVTGGWRLAGLVQSLASILNRPHPPAARPLPPVAWYLGESAFPRTLLGRDCGLDAIAAGALGDE